MLSRSDRRKFHKTLAEMNRRRGTPIEQERVVIRAGFQTASSPNAACSVYRAGFRPYWHHASRQTMAESPSRQIVAASLAAVPKARTKEC